MATTLTTYTIYNDGNDLTNVTVTTDAAVAQAAADAGLAVTDEGEHLSHEHSRLLHSIVAAERAGSKVEG